MDIGRALTFISDDDRWVEKTAIGTGLLLISSMLLAALIGILGYFILFGYLVRLMQNVRDEVHPVLPEWDQWGDDLVRGVKLACIYFVWALPIMLVSIPITIIGIAFDDSNFGGDGLAATLAICAFCINFIFGICYAILQPGFTIAFLRNEEIGDGLQVSEIWEWTRNNIGNVVIVALFTMIATVSLIAVGSIVGLILCIIGVVVTLPSSLLIAYYLQGHLYGQLARISSQDADGGAVAAMPQPDFGVERPLDPEDAEGPLPAAEFVPPTVFQPDPESDLPDEPDSGLELDADLDQDAEQEPDSAAELDTEVESDIAPETEQPEAGVEADQAGTAEDGGASEGDDPSEETKNE